MVKISYNYSLVKKMEHKEFTYNCKIIHYMSDMQKLHYKID